MSRIDSTARKLSDASRTAFHEQCAKTDQALRHYDWHVDAVLSDSRLSRRSAKFLERLWYAPAADDCVTLAQRPVRDTLTKALMLVVLRHCENDRAASCGPDRVRLLSTCPDVGYCDYARGKLRVGAVERHFQRCMQRRELEGVGVPDLALIDAGRCGDPSELGFHYHGVCRPLPGSSKTALRPKTGSKTSAKKNKYGLAVVRQDFGASPLTPWDVASLTHYTAKLSCGLKEDHRGVTRTSHLHWSHEHALRALEVLSHVPLQEGLCAVGPFGQTLRDECIAAFWGFLGRPKQPQAQIDHRHMTRQWQRLQRELELDDEMRPLRIGM